MKKEILYCLFFLTIARTSYSQDTLTLNVGGLDASKIVLTLNRSDTLSLEDTLKLKDSSWVLNIIANDNTFKVKLQNTSGSFNPNITPITRKDSMIHIVKKNREGSTLVFGNVFSMDILDTKQADAKIKSYSKLALEYANKIPGRNEVPFTTNLPGNKSCGVPASPQFISLDMIDKSKSDFLFNMEECVESRKKRKLSGEYILLYDYRKGDYYPLKKVLRKTGEGWFRVNSVKCKDSSKYVEYYQLKRSKFFSPQAYSQLKVELMNYNDTIPLNLEVFYRDNFLEEESRFRSTLTAFQQGGTKKTDTAGAKADTAKGAKAQGKGTSDFLKQLDQLNQELCYYVSNFNYNSLTSDQHQENVKAIIQNIRDEFGIKQEEDIVEGIRRVTTLSDISPAITRLRTLLRRLDNFQSVIYTAFRVKNRDDIMLQFRDDKGKIRKEEELHITNGFKVDFSTGIFLTGLKDINYVFKDTTVSYRVLRAPGDTVNRDTTGKFILRDYSSKRKIGFGLLAHAYPRLSSNYNLGIATGISVNTEAEINLLAGFSLMLGSERRVVFSGGFIWGKANRLSNTVSENFNWKKDKADGLQVPVYYSTPNNVVPVVNDWERSWFAGVSYNFTSNR